MPQPMAEALGWPTTEIGWSDVLALAKDPQGWATKGHPEWGKFTLGKTNPSISTSGLAATIGTLVAATGTSSDLTERRWSDRRCSSICRTWRAPSCTTATPRSPTWRTCSAPTTAAPRSATCPRRRWRRRASSTTTPATRPATRRRSASTRAPKVPLVAVYPKEGTLYSDSPYVVLNAPWSTDQKKAGAADFLAYLQQPDQQKLFTDNFFRTADHQPGEPITSSPYLIADGVKITLNPPGPEVLAQVRAVWSEVRKPARVLLLLDVSGSMAADSGNGQSKLDLAKTAAAAALGQLVDRDQVGLWTFTTDMGTPTDITNELVPIAPLDREPDRRWSTRCRTSCPLNGTPLYAATKLAVDDMNGSLDADSINAVVLLTDGRNEYTDQDLQGLLDQLSQELAGARGAGVLDRLRCRCGPGDPEADLAGVPGGGLRRSRPGEHHQGLRQRAVQLLSRGATGCAVSVQRSC